MMKKFLILSMFAMGIVSCQTKDVVHSGYTYKPFTAPINYQEASRRADSLVNLMTLQEKINYISGHNQFMTYGIDRLGIPAFQFSDASMGIDFGYEYKPVSFKHLEKTTAFPATIGLSATWSRELSYKMAHAIGEECKAAGVAVLLGPGMNIYRSSTNGRNFEYLGEDPFLASRIVENYVVGLQNTGTIATLKHFLCNNVETYRKKQNSIVDERTINEIYIPAFQAGIDAGAKALMASYNLVNGEYTGQSYQWLTKLLREQMGYKGFIMSDWWSIYDAKKAIKSGLDLEMSGDPDIYVNYKTPPPYAFLKHEAGDLLKKNEVTEDDISKMVKRHLTAYIEMGLLDRPVLDSTLAVKLPEHEQLVKDIVAESVVLLKNDGVLPLGNFCKKKILVTGENATKYVQGDGAAGVRGYNHVSLLKGMQMMYPDQVTHKSFVNDEDIKEADIIIYSTGIYETEGVDRDFSLPDSINNQIKRIAAINKNVVVVMNVGGGVDVTPWIDDVKALIYAWYPGQCGNLSVAQIIKGDINPSGKLPITIEKKFSDSPAYGYKPTSYPSPKYDIEYTEGVFVGYRWYDHQKLAVQYPFGFGLSYTTFEYSNLAVKNNLANTQEAETSFTITNTGQYDGAEVAQLYISDLESTLPRPLKELKGFEKVFLKAGESKNVIITLNKKDFSFYDPQSHQWVMEKGLFDILIGSSSQDIKLRERIEY